MIDYGNKITGSYFAAQESRASNAVNIPAQCTRNGDGSWTIASGGQSQTFGANGRLQLNDGTFLMCNSEGDLVHQDAEGEMRILAEATPSATTTTTSTTTTSTTIAPATDQPVAVGVALPAALRAAPGGDPVPTMPR